MAPGSPTRKRSFCVRSPHSSSNALPDDDGETREVPSLQLNRESVAVAESPPRRTSPSLRPRQHEPKGDVALTIFSCCAFLGVLCFLAIMLQLYSQVSILSPFAPPTQTMNALHVQVEVDLLTLYTGGTLRVRPHFHVEKQVVCATCHGHGYDINLGMKQCPHCRGAGVTVHQQVFGNRVHRVHQPCDHCGATGHIPHHVCDVCHGRGHHMRHEPVELVVQRGMAHGDQLVLRGQGHDQVRVVAGDLVVTLIPMKTASSGMAHRRGLVFRRHGHDLEVTLTISLVEALVGFDHQVDHLDGHAVAVTHDGPIHPDFVLRVPHEGMPLPSSSSKFGDLVVTFRIVFPSSPLSPVQQRRLAELLP
ncbi:Aste57867_16289 [Aphanomyces stellatus]|uniref:Aste57867_16289 protein n=1 Tax=Aphanomyces stellatus TaxID=120398 RepID=A0A485L5C0_9STRA|nr:hypothetical protein As57867_016232 [Aphanomyces stellatus]VFT93065.1 Aste57867_16289 [Aphanomyces stellatus]